MAYVFTASKPSSIRLACKANFVSGDYQSLVTASSNIIHIYQQDSLLVAHEIPIYGRVSTITPFKSFQSPLDHLLVTTEQEDYFAISLRNGKIVTDAIGNLTTSGLATPDMGHRVVANALYLVLYLYNGILFVIPIHQSTNIKKKAADGNLLLGPPQQLRLDELKIHDLVMLDGFDSNTVLAVLYRDMQLDTHLKTYELVVRKNEIEIKKGPYQMKGLEHGANTILSRGSDGVICVGESNLYTKSTSRNQEEFPISTPTLFNSSTRVTEESWVLGDDYGLLYSLTFNGQQPAIRRLEHPINNNTNTTSISIPHVLVMLSKTLFVGSHYGDSQLLKFPSLEILARKTNIGPIQDILVQPPQGAAGSSSLITASGAFKDGALKIIKYGVGMTEKAELEIPGVRAIWGIDALGVIVLSFVDSYLVLRVNDNGEIEQLDAGQSEVIYACTVQGRLILITRNEIKLHNDGVCLSSHSLESISIAKHIDDKIVLLNKNVLETWQVTAESIHKVADKDFETDVSAFDLFEKSVVVGFWNTESLWFGTIELEERIRVPLDSGAIPHSIVVQKLSSMDQTTLFVAMKDGTLSTYSIDLHNYTLSNNKKSVLGTVPAQLTVFATRQGPNIFATSDRPTIIHSSRSKLAFSSISIASCTCFAAFNSSILNCCMIIASEEGLKIGEIDDIQKLQFRSITLGELPRRLVKSENFIAVLTMRMEVENLTGNEIQRSFLKLLDETTLEVLDDFELLQNEMCQSLAVVKFSGEYRIAVGTSFADDEQEECTRGRILVFGVNEVDSSLWLETQIEVPGSVYCLAHLGESLVAGINSFVRLYEFNGTTLIELSKFRSSTFALTIAVRGSTLLIGDLMKSVTYLRVENSELVEIARDYVPTWMTSVDYADDTHFCGAEAEGNLILLQQSDSPLDENKMRLDRVGEYHYGEMINKLVAGVLVAPEDLTIVRPHTLFGTVDGSLGVIGSIETDKVNLLVQLQANIGQVKPGIGGLKHAKYRAFKSTGSDNHAPMRFVDGDLIEEFLDLSEEDQRSVCEGLEVGVTEIEKIVEDLARLR